MKPKAQKIVIGLAVHIAPFLIILKIYPLLPDVFTKGNGHEFSKNWIFLAELIPIFIYWRIMFYKKYRK
jgi:hypothetical protein